MYGLKDYNLLDQFEEVNRWYNGYQIGKYVTSIILGQY